MGRLGLVALLTLAVGAGGADAAERGFSAQPQDLAPRFSPDGRLLAFLRTARPGQALWVVGADGRGSRRVATVAGEGSFGWTPDGALLYHSGAEIRVVRADGGADRLLAHGSIGAQPVSRDGLVAYADGGQLRVVDLAGGKSRLVLRGDVARPSIAADGRRIAYVDAGDVWVANVDGTDRRRLAPGDGTPVWSPDGEWIGHSAWAVTPDGTKAVRLSAPVVDWSPDGAHVLLSAGTGFTVAEVGTFRGLRRVPAARHTGGAWSPDGAALVYSDTVAGCRRYGVAVFRLRDEAVRRVTQDCRRIGTGARDRIVGTPLSDVVYGLAGDDRIVGGGAADVLYGGPGRDVLLARDGVRDAVVCGPGRDLAYADRFDTVRGCETVRY